MGSSLRYRWALNIGQARFLKRAEGTRPTASGNGIHHEPSPEGPSFYVFNGHQPRRGARRQPSATPWRGKGSALTIDTDGGGQWVELKGTEGGDLPGHHGTAARATVHAYAGLDGFRRAMGT